MIRSDGNGHTMNEEVKTFNHPTTVTITNGYGTYSVSVNHSDCDLGEMIDLVRRALLAAGYHCGELEEIDDDRI